MSTESYLLGILQGMLLSLLLLILGSSANAMTIKIAILDTGFDTKAEWGVRLLQKHGLVAPKLCPTGHYNFVNDNTDISDNHGHGTHVAGIVAKQVKDLDYCLIILKYFDPNSAGNNLTNTIRAFERAVKLGVDYINYSGGGMEHSPEEKHWVTTALDLGIGLGLAAGNERRQLKDQPFYPAMYDSRAWVVGALNRQGRVLSSSNKGAPFHELGDKVMSILPDGEVGPMTGTSQATPTYLGKRIVLWETLKRLLRQIEIYKLKGLEVV